MGLKFLYFDYTIELTVIFVGANSDGDCSTSANYEKKNAEWLHRSEE